MEDVRGSLSGIFGELYYRSSFLATCIAPTGPVSVSLSQPMRFGRDAPHRRMSGGSHKTGSQHNRWIDAVDLRIELMRWW